METLKKVLDPIGLLQTERVVVVTGADKGIGYATVKGILKENPNWTVYLTSRSTERAELASRRCYEEINLTPSYHELDIDSIDSIRRFREYIRENHKNGIHILVNNAGVFENVRAAESLTETEMASPRPTEQQEGHVEKEVKEAGTESAASKEGEKKEEEKKEGERKEEEEKKEEEKKEEIKFKYDRTMFKSVINSNFFSTLQVCKELFPLLGDNSSVVFVGSRLGHLAFHYTKDDKQLLLRGCQTVEDVSKLMECLMNSDPDKLYSTKEDDKDAWLAKSPDIEMIPNYLLGECYPFAMAKLGLSIICRIYQLQFDGEKRDQNVHVVACCPGLVKTDSNPKGVRTPEQGAETIVWAALQPKDTPVRGVFVADQKPIDPFLLPEHGTIFDIPAI